MASPSITPNTKLAGTSVIMLNGTVSTITEVIVSGYKIEGRSRRLLPRGLAKIDGKFYELPELPMDKLTASKHGYVIPKEGAFTPTKLAPAKSAKAQEAKAPAKSKPKEKAGKKQAADPDADDAGDAESLTEITQPFSEALANRVLDFTRRTAQVGVDGGRIDNEFDIQYGAEYTANTIRVTLDLSYVLAQPAQEESGYAIPDSDVALARKKVGKTWGKKLAAAILSTYGTTTADFAGTVLQKDGEDTVVIVVGPHVEDNEKLMLYVVDGESKFRRINGASLKNYTPVEDEGGEDPDEEEEEEESDDFDDEGSDDDADDGEGSDDDDGDDGEGSYMFYAIEDEHTENVDAKKTAAFFKKLTKHFELESAFEAGMVMSDGETNYAMVGVQSDGSILVIDVDDEDGDLLAFDADSVDSILEMELVHGDSGLDDDFEGSDPQDYDDETLRDYVVEQELTTASRAMKMSRSKLLALLP